jgi:hypothetical protein
VLNVLSLDTITGETNFPSTLYNSVNFFKAIVFKRPLKLNAIGFSRYLYFIGVITNAV